MTTETSPQVSSIGFVSQSTCGFVQTLAVFCPALNTQCARSPEVHSLSTDALELQLAGVHMFAQNEPAVEHDTGFTLPAAVSGQIEPAGQGRHADWPVDGWYWPAEHTVHDACLPMLNFPAAHAVCAVAA